jgi:hypothetical protein
MLARLNTFALVGIDAVPVIAEVDATVRSPRAVSVMRMSHFRQEGGHRDRSGVDELP